MQKSCQFCSDASVGTRTIYKDELVWVFPTNMPIVPGHLLICPTRCVATIEELTSEEATALFVTIKKAKIVLKSVFDAQGFNMAFNEGTMAGQSVPHLHIHILPRKEGDTGIVDYEPRQFLYRPGTRAQSADAELVEVAESLKRFFL